MVDENETWKTVGDKDSDVDSDMYDPYDLENYAIALDKIYSFFVYYYNGVVSLVRKNS